MSYNFLLISYELVRDVECESVHERDLESEHGRDNDNERAHDLDRQHVSDLEPEHESGYVHDRAPDREPVRGCECHDEDDRSNPVFNVAWVMISPQKYISFVLRIVSQFYPIFKFFF